MMENVFTQLSTPCFPLSLTHARMLIPLVVFIIHQPVHSLSFDSKCGT